MQDVWKPELNNQIDRFLSRKAREFPELELSKGWNTYEYTANRKLHNHIKTSK